MRSGSSVLVVGQKLVFRAVCLEKVLHDFGRQVVPARVEGLLPPPVGDGQMNDPLGGGRLVVEPAPLLRHHALPVLHVGQHIPVAGDVLAVDYVAPPLGAPLPKVHLHARAPRLV